MGWWTLNGWDLVLLNIILAIKCVLYQHSRRDWLAWLLLVLLLLPVPCTENRWSCGQETPLKFWGTVNKTSVLQQLSWLHSYYLCFPYFIHVLCSPEFEVISSINVKSISIASCVTAKSLFLPFARSCTAPIARWCKISYDSCNRLIH